MNGNHLPVLCGDDDNLVIPGECGRVLGSATGVPCPGSRPAIAKVIHPRSTDHPIIPVIHQDALLPTGYTLGEGVRCRVEVCALPFCVVWLRMNHSRWHINRPLVAEQKCSGICQQTSETHAPSSRRALSVQARR